MSSLGVQIDVEEFLKGHSGNLDDLWEYVADKAAREIAQKYEREISEQFERKVTDAVDAKISKLVDETLDGEFQPTNRYGEKKGDPITMTEFVAESCRKHLTEKVKLGRGNYDDPMGSRAEKVARDAATKFSDKVLDNAVKEASSAFKKEMAKRLANHMSESLKEVVKGW